MKPMTRALTKVQPQRPVTPLPKWYNDVQKSVSPQHKTLLKDGLAAGAIGYGANLVGNMTTEEGAPWYLAPAAAAGAFATRGHKGMRQLQNRLLPTIGLSAGIDRLSQHNLGYSTLNHRSLKDQLQSSVSGHLSDTVRSSLGKLLAMQSAAGLSPSQILDRLRLYQALRNSAG